MTLEQPLKALYADLVRTAVLDEQLVIDRHRAGLLIDAAKSDIYAQLMGLITSPEYKHALDSSLEAKRVGSAL